MSSGMKNWEHLKISFEQIKDATNDFGKTIGRGGYGTVYKGKLFIKGRHIKVAVKRLNEESRQGLGANKDGILLSAVVAKEYYANDKLDRIIDPVLRQQMSTEPLKKFSAIAYKCLQDREHRPLMDFVKKELEETLKIQTSMYLAFPISLSAGERLIRAVRLSVKTVKILKVGLYHGNALALHMSKPRGFKYKSGQYMFVNCADVSPNEWHPFFITSAPDDDYLSVHIQTLGDWTRQLKSAFSEVCQSPSNAKRWLQHYQGQPIFPRVLIDGPYGSQTQDYKKYDVVLLVGVGIGAAPMISIVKDILNNMKDKEEENPLENGTTLQKNKSGSNNFRTMRAYFYWVIGEQGSFDWFKGVLNEAAEMDKNGVIEMHNYCTSVYEEGDDRSAIVTALQRLNHAKNGVDVVSGTRVISHFGKPDWQNVYKQIAFNHTGSRIGVFYCGEPTVAQELKQLASHFSHKTSTKFEFHK
ncbi:hypothetical protein L1987_48032 [Smallanthus sonchifolius]|uniref:Uncharacterized protein n=1 Tax=Smallanthus sonchifolius TaxID=185202 RepID=A0ACB9FSG0_9ASTR|nr:hypothetical protein L1987_48032 [Smallanthus sonchifolius]